MDNALSIYINIANTNSNFQTIINDNIELYFKIYVILFYKQNKSMQYLIFDYKISF